jgi:hypothetical protein
MSAPTLRKNFFAAPNVKKEITPEKGYAGCVVVETFKDAGGSAKSRIVLYVAAGAEGQSASYTPRTQDGAWLIDLPEGFSTSLSHIAEAIGKGTGKPGEPPPWGLTI